VEPETAINTGLPAEQVVEITKPVEPTEPKAEQSKPCWIFINNANNPARPIEFEDGTSITFASAKIVIEDAALAEKLLKVADKYCLLVQ